MPKNEVTNIQYQLHGDTYLPCGTTSKIAPPGFYDVVEVGMGGWGLRPKSIVSDNLIDIPGTVADEIFADIDVFLSSKDTYQSYGLTHKRGYLFFGPPGSGKTSIAMMLARRFIESVGGVVLYIDNVRNFYNGVEILRTVEPGRPSMYLIEEADNIIDNVHCLSILDGELSMQGAVFVAMTNYKETLPPRIANRPGRFDRVVKVDCPPEGVQLEYLRRVESRVGSNPDAPLAIVKALSGLPMSMAHLREAFISHVLMGCSLPDLRDRFEKMAGGADDDEEDSDPELKSWDSQWDPNDDD